MGGSDAPSDTPDPVGGSPTDPPPVDPPPVDPPADIRFQIIDPAQTGRQYSDLVDIVTYVESSEFQIDSVSAKVGSAETTLTFVTEAYYNDHQEPQPGYVGMLDLTGFARGTQTMTFTARDVTGGVLTVLREFTLNNRPELTLLAPEKQSVVTNSVRVVANCTDDTDSCRIEVRTGDGWLIGSFNSDAIDRDVELDYSGPNPYTISVSGIDEFGRSSERQDRGVYVFDETTLSLEAEIDGTVIDADEARVLYHPVDATAGPVFLLDRDSGEIERIDFPADTSIHSALLSPTGFVLLLNDLVTPGQEVLYEWRSGALTMLSSGDIKSVDVAGDYAIWIAGLALFRYQFSAVDTIEVSGFGETPDVAANGVVVFRSVTGIDWFESGVLTPLVSHSDEDYYAASIKTDGSRVAYRRYDPITRNSGLAIIEGDLPSDPVETVVIQLSPGPFSFEINNGWLAYTDAVGVGQQAVFRRDPQGNTNQVSFFGDDAAIEALAPDGRIVMSYDNAWYLSDPAAADVNPRRLNGVGGDVLVRDEGLLFLLGRAVFSPTGQFDPPPDTPPDIDLYIVKPGFTNAKSGDLLDIIVEIESEFQIDTVIARAETIETTLVYSTEAYTNDYQEPQPAYVGTLDLSSLDRGDQTVEVQARDFNGGVVTVTRGFLLNNRPVLTLIEPKDQSVVTNPVRFVASCTDDTDTCRIEIAKPSGGIIKGFSTDEIDTELELTFSSGIREILVRGRDEFDQIGDRNDVTIYMVDETILLREADVDGLVIEADAVRVLYRASDADDDSVFALDRGTGNVEPVELPADTSLQSAMLSPTGVLLLVDNLVAPNDERLYEWRDGGLTLLASGVIGSLKVAGDFGLWAANGGVFRYQFSTEETVEVTDAGALPDLAENGVVVFRGLTGIDWFESGVVTPLVDHGDESFYASSIRTDGSRVAYRRYNPGPRTGSVVIIEGDLPSSPIETTVTPPLPGFETYLINNGWLAFTDAVITGQLAIWRRDPDGNVAQVSFFGDDSSLEALGADGSLVLNHAFNWYLSTPDNSPGDPVLIDNDNGVVQYRDGQFYFLIGRSAFTLF